MNELQERDLADLAALVADVRALVEDSALRGVREEVQQLAAPGIAAPAAGHAPAKGWHALAAEARAAEIPAGKQLERVREDLGDCRRCGLCKERRNIVFGVGDPDADLVVVGEAPGYHEDQQAEPFVGPAGQMLDKMLENVIKLRRDQVYILNVVKCRPPKNRNPEPDEIEACRPYLEAQLAAIAPKVVLVLGSVAYRALFRTEAGIKRSRGRWHEHEVAPGRVVPAMPTFHPAYLRRQPDDKKLTFADLKAVVQRYDELGGRR
ncbi:MAG: uracil-DNA glycosylase [Myxococcota bacterium]